MGGETPALAYKNQIEGLANLPISSVSVYEVAEAIARGLAFGRLGASYALSGSGLGAANLVQRVFFAAGLEQGPSSLSPKLVDPDLIANAVDKALVNLLGVVDPSRDHARMTLATALMLYMGQDSSLSVQDLGINLSGPEHDRNIIDALTGWAQKLALRGQLGVAARTRAEEKEKAEAAEAAGNRRSESRAGLAAKSKVRSFPSISCEKLF